MADPSTPNADLDTEELMHLALRANEQADTEKTIGYLKQVLSAEPENGMALYLLGAQHAQMKMYGRAIAEMEQAIEVEPNIPATAHFQLGLLYLTSGAVPESLRAWLPLDQLGENDALFLFKRGLVHLIQDEFPECIENLEKGIAVNVLYPALSIDMQKFADKARAAMLQPKPVAQPEPAEARQAPKGPAGADLSAYKPEADD
jgi:tetratricopeptide (TPR) repeat protein